MVSALAYWILGALWYGVFFGARWMALENIAPRQTQGANAAVPYLVSLVLDVLIAYVLALLCRWRGANTAGSGAAVGLLLWIGIVGPITYTTSMYAMRSRELFAINEFYPLAGLCLMGAISGAWTKKVA